MEIRVLVRAVFLLLRLQLLLDGVVSFNLDVSAPVFKIGPPNSYFGFSVAEHFRGKDALILVGAPRAESGQPGTIQAGAVFSCPVTASYTNIGPEWCKQELVEYVNSADMKVPPVNATEEKRKRKDDPHPTGKNKQYLGALVASSAVREGVAGKALVCAPLKRFNPKRTDTDGDCFILEEDLTLMDHMYSCSALDRIARHNAYGACLEGFSGYIENHISRLGKHDTTVITGVPGARKWTGGVSTRYIPGSAFVPDLAVSMAVQGDNAVTEKLEAHDYLGYSVTRGKYGFWYEDAYNWTVVSGATRLYGSGAVVFLMTSETNVVNGMKSLELTDDKFILNGTRLGSGFGYSVVTIGLNNDGFDDLIVGAPFEYAGDAAEGGAVYVYYSSGTKRGLRESSKVFQDPIRIVGKGIHSHFGAAVAALGNVDGDPDRLNDFAVGAPYAEDGGAVYIFSGAKSREEFSVVPEQEIHASAFEKIFPGNGKLETFGFALAGASDMDGNKYNDLLVGAYGSDAVVLLRARPVINIKTWHWEENLRIDIERSGCGDRAVTCFNVTTALFVDPLSTKTSLFDFQKHVFMCILQVVSLDKSLRAILSSGSDELSWDCGRRANLDVLNATHTVYVLKSNLDFINPLKFKFSVRIRDESTPEFPRNGGTIVDLNQYPVLNKFGSEHTFTVGFNKECGEDDICECDLVLEPAFTEIGQQLDGTYVTQVNETAAINIAVKVKNAGERAYEASMLVEYNSAELEVPIIKNKRDGQITIKTTQENLAVIFLGNPMEPNADLAFQLAFKLAKGRTGGLGKPLEFRAYVNSTSDEKNEDDNTWSAVVRVIKRAELELTADSIQRTVYFGGNMKGASALESVEEIGPEVTHQYNVRNHGPWAVNNVTVKIEWPYQIESGYEKGKFALYLVELPVIKTSNVDDQQGSSKRCSVPLASALVNPLGLITSKSYTIEDEINAGQSRSKRETPVSTSAFGLQTAKSRHRDVKTEEREGESVAPISKAAKTAKTFTVTCTIDFLSELATATIELQSRLWNATFVEDYYDVGYVAISSEGHIELDPKQGIEETDINNNHAFATTHAYPDRPGISETKPVPWWLYAAAILGGLLILLCIILILWKCGFFKRNRPNQPVLHQAEFQYRQEEWTES